MLPQPQQQRLPQEQLEQPQEQLLVLLVLVLLEQLREQLLVLLELFQLRPIYIGKNNTWEVPPSLKSIETFPSGLSYVPREAAVRS